MFKSFRSGNVLLVVNNSLVDLPSPSSLTYFWNFGSLLGLFLFFQILSGLFLSFHFSSDVVLSFSSVIHMMRDVNYGWILRVVHANGASIFFMLMYIHIGRGIYYGSYRFYETWLSGVSILLLSMATAFLGYVLPWGQMSFWAATVITNLLSVIPFVGGAVVEWVWGGYAVSNPTLVRFFAFHFILPFIILFMVILHLVFLHSTGSSNPLGLSGVDSVVFHYYYMVSDLLGLMVVFIGFMAFCLLLPYLFMDVENFIFSNPLVTPIHIQPEWYFLFAYAILRSVSSSVGGVIALMMSILILYIVPFFLNFRFRSVFFVVFLGVFYWGFVVNWMLLTWIGACEVESPYSELSFNFSVMYFSMYGGFWVIGEMQDLILLWFYF